MREKAADWGLSNEETNALLEALLADGFVDDQRFANAFCHDKFEFNSWGKQKIRAHISRHGLSKGIVDKALRRIDAVKYESRLRTLSQKKWQSLSGHDELVKKQKTINYLANKGFELDLIWKIVGQLRDKRL